MPNPSNRGVWNIPCRQLILPILLAFFAATAAPPAAAQALTPEQEALHQELRALKDRLSAALNSGDIDKALMETDPNISFTAMNNEVAHGRDGVRQYFQKMMTGDDRIVQEMKVSFEPDQLATIYGDDNAIATGRSKAHFKLTKGIEFDLDGRWTADLVRQDGHWLLAGAHYSVNMFDNPLLENAKRLAWIVGLGTGVVALIVGFLLGRWRRRPAVA
jgi:ketosteroid isomerase-like protein